MVVTEARTNPSSSVSLAFMTTAPTRPARAPLVCSFHSRIEPRTLASTTRSGWTVLGLGGRGKLSEMPVLGALKAERGKVGRDLGPFLRAPTPGEMGRLAIKVVAGAMLSTRLSYIFDVSLSHVSFTLRLWLICLSNVHIIVPTRQTQPMSACVPSSAPSSAFSLCRKEDVRENSRTSPLPLLNKGLSRITRPSSSKCFGVSFQRS